MKHFARGVASVLAVSVAALVAVSAQAAKPPPSPPPNLAFSPGSYTFDLVAVGTSATHDFTLKNTGKGSSGHIAVTLSPAVGPFSLAASNCAKGLDPKATCTVSVRYTPQVGGASDSATLKATAGSVTSNLVSLSGTSPGLVNQPPIADATSVTSIEDSSLGITLSGGDPEGGTVDFLATAPSHGTLLEGTLPVTGTCSVSVPSTCTANVTYFPTVDYYGTDSFTFVTKDSAGNTSTPATVTITLDPVNDYPVGVNDEITTTTNTAVDFTLVARDIDDNAQLSFTVTKPDDFSGTLTADTTGTCIADPDGGTYCYVAAHYTPAADSTYNEQFTFTVYDGWLESINSATVAITVVAPNTPPTVDNTEFTLTTADLDPYSGIVTLISAAVGHDPDAGSYITSFDVAYSDPDTSGTPFSFYVPSCADDTTSGCVCTGDIQWSPPSPESSGTYQFTYTATDNLGATSTTGTVTIYYNLPS